MVSVTKKKITALNHVPKDLLFLFFSLKNSSILILKLLDQQQKLGGMQWKLLKQTWNGPVLTRMKLLHG
jgi:hypothetical protein